MEEKDYYTIQEVADYFRVMFSSVYVWIKSGKISVIDNGNKVLIPKEELIRFIEESN